MTHTDKQRVGKYRNQRFNSHAEPTCEPSRCVGIKWTFSHNLNGSADYSSHSWFQNEIPSFSWFNWIRYFLRELLRTVIILPLSLNWIELNWSFFRCSSLGEFRVYKCQMLSVELLLEDHHNGSCSCLVPILISFNKTRLGFRHFALVRFLLELYFFMFMVLWKRVWLLLVFIWLL
jgi:hypothetical protein